MPLYDHFHPPLSARRHWQAFHNAWATYLASDLNSRLPEGYFAEPNVQFGIEIDVATWEEPLSRDQSPNDVAVATRSCNTHGSAACGQEPSAYKNPWAPPAPAVVLDYPLDVDAVEVLVYDATAGPTLAGAIELVSPANKDRPEHREAFVAKCHSYLQQAVGLVVVDVVTARRANLHQELLAAFPHGSAKEDSADLYAAAYRLAQQDEARKLEIWQESLGVGKPLPTMPLWLRGGLCLPVELDATYQRTCHEQRVTVESA